MAAGAAAGAVGTRAGRRPADTSGDARRWAPPAELAPPAKEAALAKEFSPWQVFSEAFRGLGNAWPAFLDALAAAASDPRDTAHQRRLQDAARRLAALQARVDATPRLRPWLMIRRTAQRATVLIIEAARALLDAVAADTPLLLEQAQQRGQQAQDAARAALEDFSERLDRWWRIEEAGDPGEVLATLAAEAYRVASAEDLIALERAGAGDYRRLVGNRGEDCPPGMGLTLRLLTVYSEFALDEERFWNVARRAYATLQARPDRFATLITSAHLLDDLHDGAARGHDAILEAQTLLDAARNDRQAVKALLTLALDLLEGPGKRYIAALLAVTRKREEYARLRDIDAGALLIQAEQAGLSELLDGLDAALRGARAHHGFRVDDDGAVVLTGRGSRQRATRDARDRDSDEGRGGERVPIATLVDRVLAGSETVLALDFALSCAAAQAGVTVHDPATLHRLGLTDDEIALAVLSLLGWTDLTTHLEAVADDDNDDETIAPADIAANGDDARVQACGGTEGTTVLVASGIPPLDEPVPDPSQRHAARRSGRRPRRSASSSTWRSPFLAALLTSAWTQRCAHVTITARTDTGERRVTGPAWAWRAFNDPQDPDGRDELGKQLRFVEALHRWTLDGQPGLSADQLRRWAAGMAAQQANAGYPGCLPPLRRLRDLARRLGDEPLAAAVTGLVGAVRAAALDVPDPTSSGAILRQLTEWASADVPDVALTATGWVSSCVQPPGREARRVTAAAP